MPILDKDACELLDADHLAVKHLFVAYARLAMSAPSESASERRSTAMRICRELTIHAQIEEEIFYPALRKAVPEAAPLLDEAKSEHDEARQLIAQIQSNTASDQEADLLVARLASAVEHHVKEERDELFPKARAADMDLEALGKLLQQRQQELEAGPEAA